MGRLRHREAKPLAQDHTASKCGARGWMDLPGCGAHLCLATLPPFPKMQRPPTWKAASGEPGASRVFMSFFHFPLRSHPSPRLCRLQPPGSVFCISNLEGGKWHEILLAGVGEGLAGLFSLHRSPWPWDSMILKRNGARRPFRDPPASAGADCSVAWRVVGLPQQADLLAIFAVATHCTRVLQGQTHPGPDGQRSSSPSAT